MSLKIAYYGNCWMTNLGEAFIDIGAMEILRRAMPASNVIFVTPMSHYYNNALRLKAGKPTTSKDRSTQNSAHLGKYISADIFVMSGMFATEAFLQTGSASYWIDDFLKNNPSVKVLLMGIGGQEYSLGEVKAFSTYLKEKMALKGFVSRDDEIFHLYNKLLPNCRRGIDCAFFVSDVYNPCGFSNKEYVVSSFNTTPEPEILKSFVCDVIRPQHMFYSAVYQPDLENVFISDAPLDYLSLYANAREVHTDLVHATIVSLTYGIKVKYYGDSKRSLAFEAVGAVKDSEGYLYVPKQLLEYKKLQLVETTRELLST